jgi:hypothetical protein
LETANRCDFFDVAKAIDHGAARGAPLRRTEPVRPQGPPAFMFKGNYLPMMRVWSCDGGASAGRKLSKFTEYPQMVELDVPVLPDEREQGH